MPPGSSLLEQVGTDIAVLKQRFTNIEEDFKELKDYVHKEITAMKQKQEAGQRTLNTILVAIITLCIGVFANIAVILAIQ